MRRQRVAQPVKTGVRVIDLFTPLCAGQRIGIFAGSGVGKSTLLAMLARARRASTPSCIALVGERGREVREFMEDALRPGAQARTIAVVATGDESPMMRRLAPKTAMSHRRVFPRPGRERAADRRFGDALCPRRRARWRWPPASRRWRAAIRRASSATCRSCWSGPARARKAPGSITGIFSVLVDGDDHNDPVADSIRGTLDGHIVLDRAIADQGRYPGRQRAGLGVAPRQAAWTAEQRKLVMKLRAMIARFEDTRDLRLMGGYRRGADPALDRAIELVPQALRGHEAEPRRAAQRRCVPGDRPRAFAPRAEPPTRSRLRRGRPAAAAPARA